MPLVCLLSWTSPVSICTVTASSHRTCYWLKGKKTWWPLEEKHNISHLCIFLGQLLSHPCGLISHKAESRWFPQCELLPASECPSCAPVLPLSVLPSSDVGLLSCWIYTSCKALVLILAKPQMAGCFLAVHKLLQPFQAPLIIPIAHLLWCPFSGNECNIAVHSRDSKQLPLAFLNGVLGKF